MLAASITTDGEWQQLEAKCSMFVTSPVSVCYPSILLQKPSHIKQWKKDTSLFLPACCTEVPHFLRWQLKMESCRLNPAFIPNHPLQEATVRLPDGDKLNIPDTFMCPLSAIVCLVAYWGGDARGQHGTVTPGQCLYTLLGWKAMSGFPGFALLCSASACNNKFETIPAVSCSLQIIYAMVMVTASPVLLPALLILPTWSSTPPALKEVVPLLSECHEVL